jgi:hypothetical protein
VVGVDGHFNAMRSVAGPESGKQTVGMGGKRPLGVPLVTRALDNQRTNLLFSGDGMC